MVNIILKFYRLNWCRNKSIIARALIAGAERKPSFIPHAGHYGRAGKVLGIGIWTPDQILRFAKELKKSV